MRRTVERTSDEAGRRAARSIGEDERVTPLNRIAWIVTVVACAVLTVLLLVAGYQGYGALAFAVGASAAINLR